MKYPIAKLMALLIFTLSPALYAADRQVYLTRHAEKASDGTRNPPLTDTGHKRAEHIAQLLKSKDITAVYSTDYKRTQQTAAPLAKLLGLEVSNYDPRKLSEFAEQIKKSKGNLLIVGHSNTTPALAFLLGGEARGDIDESEYDRLYRLDMKNNKATTKILRSKPVQTKAKLGKLAVRTTDFFNGSLKFRMSMRGKPVGESTHNFTRNGAKTFVLHEKTIIKEMNIDADIKVSVDAKTLAPKSMNMSGTMGAPADIQLTWRYGQLKGHSSMARAAYKKQGKIDIDKNQLSGTFERSALLMLAHLIDLPGDKAVGVNWYNAYDDEMTHIGLSYAGKEKVTVPAGTFDTYKIHYEGGAPSQMFYIAAGKQPKVVKIEVLTTPWVYELVDSTVE